MYSSSCSNCQELKALDRSQREADRAHEDRLRQLDRDAEHMSADEIEELARGRRSGGSSAKPRCGHMFFDSSCSDCRHHDYSQKAARAADRRADEFSKQAQSYADKARSAADEPDHNQQSSGGMGLTGGLVVGVLVLAVALLVLAVAVSVAVYASLVIGSVASVTRLVMLKTGRCDRWMPRAHSLGMAVIKFSMITLVPSAACFALTAAGFGNTASALLLVAVPLIFWWVRRDYLRTRRTAASVPQS
jgi:uncharacterized membrane protein